MARKKKMTDKQKRFCDEYLKDLDSIRAYMVYDPPISAGCTPDRIEKVLNEAQKLCRARLITYDEMYDFLEKLRKLYPISNKNLNGCVFEIDLNAQIFPSAYKYNPESTQFE